jgi:hypothetical protein
MVEAISLMSATAAKERLSGEPISQGGNLPDPFSIFILAIRSPVTREKYLQRMGYFFDFLSIPKVDESGINIPIDLRFNKFSNAATEDINQLTNYIVKYSQGHKKRVEQKEITGSTLRNYVKPLKLFCEQMDIEIPWKKIIRRMFI